MIFSIDILSQQSRTDRHSSTSWPSCMDKSHPLDLLGHVIAAHHPTPQFQVDRLDGHVVTIRWDHDAVAGGRGERHCFVNP